MKRAVALVAVLSGVILAQPQSSPPPSEISSVTVIRKGCFGGCPRYTLTLRRQGISTYIGKHAPRLGLFAAALPSPEVFDQLAQTVSAIGFFDLSNRIGPFIEDAEQVAVTVATAQKTKTVLSYEASVAPFAGLVKMADAVAEQLPWKNLNEPTNGILGPFPLKEVAPQYTEEALQVRVQGPVIVRVEVGPDGTVDAGGIAVIQGLGMGLDEKAIEAVKQWAFKPAYRNGRPAGISMALNVAVDFQLP